MITHSGTNWAQRRVNLVHATNDATATAKPSHQTWLGTRLVVSL